MGTRCCVRILTGDELKGRDLLRHVRPVRGETITIRCGLIQANVAAIAVNVLRRVRIERAFVDVEAVGKLGRIGI